MNTEAMNTKATNTHDGASDGCEALLIGGRSGVGKSTVSWEVSALLEAARIAHVHIEGDFLDRVFPAPQGDPARSRITEANLAALWANFAAGGSRRLLYTNTVSVLEPDLIRRAMGGSPRFTMVLLTAQDDTTRDRLAGREIGSRLDPHVERSARMARHLESAAAPEVLRVRTDGRSIEQIAREVIAATGWAACADEGPADGWR